MTLLKTAFTSAALLAGGLFAMTPDTADAQVRIQFGSGGYGNGGYNNGGYRSGNSGYGNPGYNDGYHNHGGSGYSGQRSSGYRGYSNGGYSNGGRGVSHYDYHPTTVVPHGNHYDVQPGHYDLHRGGHGH